VRRTGTVSPLDLDVQKQKVQALYEDWKEAPAEGTKEKFERAVQDLQRDAAVAADSAVARDSGEALKLMQDGGTPDSTGIFRALGNLAPEKSPETPAPPVVQLVDAPGAGIERELLAILLEAAAAVVGTIGDNLESCRHAPHDREALTAIRRGF